MALRQKKNVFVIHDKETALKASAVSFLRSIGLNPIVLHGPDAPQQTVVERFEDWGSSTYALVLLASEGGASWSPEGRRLHPGRGLLFELGYFVGKLGRRYVTALYRDELELPPELSSVLCIPKDEIGIWKYALMRDLSAAGFAVRPELAVYGPRDIAPPRNVRYLVGRAGSMP